MKKLFIFSLLTILVFGVVGCACAKRYMTGGPKLSGETFSETRFNGTAINAVQTSYAWDVTLVQEGATGVSIVLPKEYKPYMVCKVEGDKLVLGFENLPKEYQSFSDDTKFEARVSVSGLRELQLSGSTDLFINSTINANCPETRIQTSGASDVKGSGHLTCQNLDLTTSGASDFILGSLECGGNARIQCTGSSDFKTSTITVNGNANITLSGASDFISALNCTGDANLQCSGSSDFKITGQAANSKIVSSGASDFRGENFKSTDVTVSCSGSSSAYVFASGRANVTSSGASDVYVYGNPTSQNFNASGSSDIRKK